MTINSPFYTLHNRTPEPCPSEYDWREWMQSADRQVAFDRAEGFYISTFFVGVDLQSVPGRKPLLFEVHLIIPEGHELQASRHATWEEAEAEHIRLLRNFKTMIAYAAIKNKGSNR